MHWIAIGSITATRLAATGHQADMRSVGMSTPKRHHFVPQMLQRRFCDANGQLWFFDKRFPNKGIRPVTPSNLFVEGHLYSLIEKDGSKGAALERHLSKVEGLAEPIIERIVGSARAGRVPALSPEERGLWDLFWYYQWKRVPDLHMKIMSPVNGERELASAMAKFEEIARPFTDVERLQLEDPEVRARLLQNAKVKALADSGPAVRAILTQRGPGFAVIKSRNKSFILGSSPILRLSNPGRSHLSDATVEVWFPISSDVAVTPAGNAGTEKVVEVRDQLSTNNLGILRQSTVVASASKALLASLVSPR